MDQNQKLTEQIKAHTQELRAIEVTSKTRKRGGPRKGFFKPRNSNKYKGDINSIVYRSGLELRLMKFLDSQPSVVSWSSEETIIPYVSPIDSRYHRYYVDFKCTMKDDEGNLRTYLIEVKESTALSPPKIPKKKTKRYYAQCRDFAVNTAKWTRAKQVCEKHNWEWLILTEKQLRY